MADKPTTPLPAYFLSLSLENVRSFGAKQTISFARPDGRPAQWTIILGDNGVGKTTVLKSLAGMMTVTTDPDGLRPLISSKQKSMNLFIRHDGWPGSKVDYSVRLGKSLKSQSLENDEILKPYWKVSYGEPSTNQGKVAWMSDSFKLLELTCYGYGAGRTVGISTLSETPETVDTCASLFDDRADLLNPGWQRTKTRLPLKTST